MMLPNFKSILEINNEQDIEKKVLKKTINKEMIALSGLLLSGKCKQDDLDFIEKLNKVYLDKYGTDKEKDNFKMKMSKLREHVKIGV